MRSPPSSPDAKDDERTANDRRHHARRQLIYSSESRAAAEKGDLGVTRDPAGRLAEALERQRLPNKRGVVCKVRLHPQTRLHILSC